MLLHNSICEFSFIKLSCVQHKIKIGRNELKFTGSFFYNFIHLFKCDGKKLNFFYYDNRKHLIAVNKIIENVDFYFYFLGEFLDCKLSRDNELGIYIYF